ncbi:MAG: hypothetical protein M3O91_09255 [Chloroflexota bacterium]|nr:hypothetical protein [Chloroflexota bacterium]
MTLVRATSAPRRIPVPVDRYRRAARSARDKRRRRTGAFALLGWLTVGVAAAIVLPVAGVTAGASFGEFARSVGASFAASAPAEALPLVIPDNASTTAGAEPVLDGLPDYTRETRVLVRGHVPAFAVRAERSLEVLVNGEPLATVPIDDQTRFAAEVILRDGANAIVARLVHGRDTIASTSRTVIVDRTPPTLALVRPHAGDVVGGATVTVEGKTEPRLQVRVNDRTVTVAADGTFSESFTAAEGALSVRVVARDLAGNETLLTVPVAVRIAPQPAGATLLVALDRTAVRPGEAVVADIILSDGGAPRAGVMVSLSVGVIAIGGARTDAAGHARIGFAAPPNEGAASVVVLAPGAAGSAILAVAR